MAEVWLDGDDSPRTIPDGMAARVNADGTLHCDRCGKDLPATTNRRDRNMNILWSHPAAGPCNFSDEERYR